MTLDMGRSTPKQTKNDALIDSLEAQSLLKGVTQITPQSSEHIDLQTSQPILIQDSIKDNVNQNTSTQTTAKQASTKQSKPDYGYQSLAENTGVNIAKRRIDSLAKIKVNPLEHIRLIVAVILGSIFMLLRFMDSWILIAWLTILIFVCFVAYEFFSSKKKQKRFDYIRSTPFPANIWQSESLRDLKLEPSDRVLITEGLRDFFLLHALKPDRPLSMPSKYVDKLWHAFILDTHNYQDYCMNAFGKILHHVPDYAFEDKKKNIRLYTYQAACRLQNINPAYPNNRVPRLFAIDSHISKVLGVTTAISLATLMGELSQSYLIWFQEITSRTADSGDGFIDDAEITDDGDASCGSSGGDGDCGGGCGGD